jgi:hypothetical protein
MTPDQINWLTWGAIQHRPHGASKWDEPGTHKAISDHCGSWGIDIATQHVLAHARDPKARTPFAIKGPTPHTEPTKGPRQPAKAGVDECRQHRGEYATACRACAAEQYTHPADPVLDDPTCTAGRELLAEIRSRRQPQSNKPEGASE